MTKTVFNPQAALPAAPYNGAKPFVLVDIDDDSPGRGDTNGHKGLARRVADKTGADYLFLDKATLEEMYPGSNSRAERLKKLFEDRGWPDFVFSRSSYSYSRLMEGNKHTALIIGGINENLASSLGIKAYPESIVPHHLSPELLHFEGQKFAREYEDLPRPFIGINLVSYDDPWRLAKKLSELRNAHNTATFFICSCHRTPHSHYDDLMSTMRQHFDDTDGKFPVIGFNYLFQAENYGLSETWNPYIGLIDQADHLIVAGSSLSMFSEPLVLGRSIYSTDASYHETLMKKGWLKDIFEHKGGKPLQANRFSPIDLTGECADKIIRRHKEHRQLVQRDLAEREIAAETGAYARIKRFLTRDIFSSQKPVYNLETIS